MTSNYFECCPTARLLGFSGLITQTLILHNGHRTFDKRNIVTTCAYCHRVLGRVDL